MSKRPARRPAPKRHNPEEGWESIVGGVLGGVVANIAGGAAGQMASPSNGYGSPVNTAVAGGVVLASGLAVAKGLGRPKAGVALVLSGLVMDAIGYFTMKNTPTLGASTTPPATPIPPSTTVQPAVVVT